MHCIMSEITGFPQMNFSSFAEKGLIEKGLIENQSNCLY